MPWIIKQPKGKEIICRCCHATIGYTGMDVHVKVDNYSAYQYIFCPSCNKKIILKEM